MQTPLEIAFVDTAPSPAAETRIRERVARLERRFDGIVSCHVYVGAPHRHHRKGIHYEIRVEVRVPGSELVVSGKPGNLDAHEDIYVAIRDSFDAMERQLEEWKERIRRDVKRHSQPH